MFLTGDHSLGADGTLVPSKGFVTTPAQYSQGGAGVSLGTNFAQNAGVRWTDGMHSKQGNVGLADGSVQQYSSSRLQEALRNSGDPGGNSPTGFQIASGCTGAGVNRIQFP